MMGGGRGKGSSLGSESWGRQDLPYGVSDLAEVRHLVKHGIRSVLECSEVQAAVIGRGEHDRPGIRVRPPKLGNQVCAGAVRQPEIEDRDFGLR
jgi:hypothetical protein